MKYCNPDIICQRIEGLLYKLMDECVIQDNTKDFDILKKIADQFHEYYENSTLEDLGDYYEE